MYERDKTFLTERTKHIRNIFRSLLNVVGYEPSEWNSKLIVANLLTRYPITNARSEEWILDGRSIIKLNYKKAFNIVIRATDNSYLLRHKLANDSVDYSTFPFTAEYSLNDKQMSWIENNFKLGAYTVKRRAPRTVKVYDREFIESRLHRAKVLIDRYLDDPIWCKPNERDYWYTAIIYGCISQKVYLSDFSVRGWFKERCPKGYTCPSRAVKRILEANGYGDIASIRLHAEFNWETFPFSLDVDLTRDQKDWINDNILKDSKKKI